MVHDGSFFGHPQRRPGTRGPIWGLARSAAIVWAAFFALVISFGIADMSTPLAVKILALAFVTAIGGGPLLLHHRMFPKDSAQPAAPQPFVPTRAAYPPHSPLGRLERIAQAAAELRARDAITHDDQVAIDARIRRLWDLAMADERSVSLGGGVSPVVGMQIQELHMRVVGLLDVAIDTAAIEPGDADLDDRLTTHLDRLNSRRSAVSELESWGLEEPS